MMRHSEIILGNAPSSGSTLLVSVIGRSKNIFQTEELYIFDKPDWVTGRMLDLQENWLANQKIGYPAHFAHETPLVFPTANSVPDYSQFDGQYASFCVSHMSAMAQSHGCSRWVEKTPTNIFSLVHLSRALPNAKFVIIVRHPAAVMQSLTKRKMNPFTAAARWYFPTLMAANLLGRPNFFVLKYEDLTADPNAVVREVFDFIEEPFLNEYLEPSANGANGLLSWSRGPADSIKASNEVPTVVSADQALYLSWLKANPYFLEYVQIERSLTTKEVCEVFGYEVEFDLSRSSRAHSTVQMGKAFAKYFLKAKLAGRPIRKLWFDWI